MSNKGKVLGTFSAKEKLETIQRPRSKSLALIKSHGIKGDRFARKNLDRSVMIVGIGAYERARDNNIQIDHGSLGENLLVDFDPNALGIGTSMSIGDAKLIITEQCSMCKSLSTYSSKLPKILSKCRGTYCKIVASGVVKIGDTVIIKEI